MMDTVPELAGLRAVIVPRRRSTLVRRHLFRRELVFLANQIHQTWIPVLKAIRNIETDHTSIFVTKFFNLFNMLRLHTNDFIGPIDENFVNWNQGVFRNTAGGTSVKIERLL